MRQRILLELEKNYDCDIRQHLRKSNVVINALRGKVLLFHITTCQEMQQELVRNQIKLVMRLMVKDLDNLVKGNPCGSIGRWVV